MDELNLKKSDLKPLLMQTIMLVCAGVLLVLAWNFIIKDFMLNFLIDNEYLGLILYIGLSVPFMINVMYSMSIYRLTLLLEGLNVDYTFSLLPIVNEYKLKELYYENDLAGVLPIITFGLSIFNTVVAILGCIFVNFKYGFYYLYEPQIIWLALTVVSFLLLIGLKSIVIGKILASYDEFLYVKNPDMYHIVPAVLISICLIYYVLLTPLQLFFGIEVFSKARLFNMLTLLIPVILPIKTLLNSIKVYQLVTYVLESSEED